MTLRAEFESFYSACDLPRGGQQEIEMRRAFMAGSLVACKTIGMLPAERTQRKLADTTMEALAECESLMDRN